MSHGCARLNTEMHTTKHRRPHTSAVLISLLMAIVMIAAACTSGRSADEQALLPVGGTAEAFTIDLPPEWDNVDVTPVSHFNNNRNLNGKFKQSQKVGTKAKFSNGAIFNANRFNQNKKFSNSTATKKLFNSNTRVFNQQFNQQFKSFNNFANFNSSVKKFNLAQQQKKFQLSKQNNFNQFNNFNNKGFNTFNSFGVNGFKGFNTQNFLKQPGRSSVFGWVSFEELDDELVADMDDEMMAWLASGENPAEMTADEGMLQMLLDESFEIDGLRGHRAIFDMDVGDGEIQRVAQQSVLNAAGDGLLTFVAGCEVECFEEHEASIVASMMSVRLAS